MCGIVAVVSKYQAGLTKQECDIFDSLLFIDQLRGADSTGVFMVEKDGDVSLAKEACNSTEFRTKPEYKTMLGDAFRKGLALVGHNRAATKGVISDENAHPFVVDDNITLVHNGTLFNHKELADTEVDSNAIAHVIYEEGDDVEKAMQRINGAYALVWSNFKEGTLNFLRNTQRPLHWMETSSAWIWASEENMLWWIASKYNLKLTQKPTMMGPGLLTTYKRGQYGGFAVNSTEIVLNKPYTYTNNITCSPPANNTHVSYGYTGSTLEEEKIAMSIGASVSASSFIRATEGFKVDDYVGIQVLDYKEVNEGHPSSGLYIYGRLLDEPDILVRTMVYGGNVDVNDLINAVLNEQKAIVRLSTKTWSRYEHIQEKKAGNLGYIRYTANGLRLVKEEELNA